ncbi:MAG: NTP transferase domain-containing protein [Desulfovibrio sp.]
MQAHKGIILAAGRGSRMLSLTDRAPKCLSEIAGQTLLDWQLDSLRKGGVEDIVVVRGYLKEMLTGDFATEENPRWAETNMVSTLACAQGYLQSGPCVVSYSDILYHPDHVRTLIAAAGDIRMTYDTEWEALWSARFQDPLADAETFRQENGQLLEIGGRTGEIKDIQGQYMGLLAFTPAGWAQVEKLRTALEPAQRDKLDMTALLNLLLDRGAEIRVVPVRGRWCEVDAESDLRLYRKNIGSGVWSHDWRRDEERV